MISLKGIEGAQLNPSFAERERGRAHKAANIISVERDSEQIEQNYARDGHLKEVKIRTIVAVPMESVFSSTRESASAKNEGLRYS